jgi:hypothetical protein
MIQHVALGIVLAAVSVGCVAADESVAKAPSFSEINKTILSERCTLACHSGGDFAAGGLDLSLSPHAVLVDAKPTAVDCAGSPMKRVVPGNPDASLLYVLVSTKVHGEAAPCGETMPLGADRAALTQGEIDRIRAWILAGAKDD